MIGQSRGWAHQTGIWVILILYAVHFITINVKESQSISMMLTVNFG